MPASAFKVIESEMGQRPKAMVRVRYRRSGIRLTAFRSKFLLLPKKIHLDLELETSVPKAYTVYWHVVNTSEEVQRASQLRGVFYDSEKSGRSRPESTLLRGMHCVEAFVVKNGVCVARSGEFVVNIA